MATKVLKSFFLAKKKNPFNLWNVTSNLLGEFFFLPLSKLCLVMEALCFLPVFVHHVTPLNLDRWLKIDDVLHRHMYVCEIL